MENAGRGAVDALERVLGPVGEPPDRGRLREGQQRRRRLRRGAPPARRGAPRLRVARGAGRRRAGRRAGEPGRAPARRRARGRGARRRRDRVRPPPRRARGRRPRRRRPARARACAARRRARSRRRSRPSTPRAPRGGPSARSTCPRGSPSDGEAPAGPVVRARVDRDLRAAEARARPAGGRRACAGRVEIADLGIPRAWLEEGIHDGSGSRRPTSGRPCPRRPMDAHKGTLRASPRGRGLRREDRRGGARLPRRPPGGHGPRDVRDAGIAAARGGGAPASSP